jgi:hypothetical protein
MVLVASCPVQLLARAGGHVAELLRMRPHLRSADAPPGGGSSISFDPDPLTVATKARIASLQHVDVRYAYGIPNCGNIAAVTSRHDSEEAMWRL